MEKMEQVRAWKFLMEQTNKVVDPCVRQAMIQEFRERAQREWGWVPDGTVLDVKPELDPDQQELYRQIQAAIQYRIDIHENERPKIYQEFALNMLEYVRDGGTLAGIPEHIRTPDVVDAYYRTLDIIGRDVMANADEVIKKSKAKSDEMPARQL